MRNGPENMFTALPYESDATLRDGVRIHIQPVTSDDESRLLVFFRALSAESRWLRFFAVLKDQSLAREAHNEAFVDGHQAFGLIALAGDNGRIVGQAFYSKVSDTRAEAAFAVADDYRGRGLGTILLFRLAKAAAANGVKKFEAEVMGENHRMLDVFRNSGFKIKSKIQKGVIHLEFPITMENFPQALTIAAENPPASCVKFPDSTASSQVSPLEMPHS